VGTTDLGILGTTGFQIVGVTGFVGLWALEWAWFGAPQAWAVSWALEWAWHAAETNLRCAGIQTCAAQES